MFSLSSRSTMLPSMKIQLGESFTKCVSGYHLMNNDPIKEAVWEDINRIVLEHSGCPVQSQSCGSHQPGADLSCSLGAFSNKSTKWSKGCKSTGNKDSFDISSYRLTSVCSDKTPGDVTTILGEIQRRKNFEYYSIIVREEQGENIKYDWYLLPSDYPAVNPESYEWKQKIGKQGKHKNSVVGWETNEVEGSHMSITFSMSSQLWMYIQVTEEMKQFVVGTCSIKKERKFNYIQLLDMLDNDTTFRTSETNLERNK